MRKNISWEPFTAIPIMKKHTTLGYKLCIKDRKLRPYHAGPYYHHEALDGTGYPFGKTAAELGVEERIMAGADIYQALTESRPYKSGMPHNKACSILYDMADKGWIDSDVVVNIDKCFANEANIL